MRKVLVLALAAVLILPLNISSFSPSYAADNANVSKLVSAGQAFTCDVNGSGDPQCWGQNNFNQTNIPIDIGKVSQISTGGNHVCALTVLGDVRCWGANNKGQSTVPANLGKVSQLSAGYEHTCAVTTTGSVRCWGSNSDGQITVPNFLGKVSQVSAGLSHTCTVSVSGVGECWGNYKDGQTNVPFDIGKLSQISSGWYHTCAITVNSTMRCWGWNEAGQTVVPTNISSWSQVSAGYDQTCAVSSSGAAYCWGNSVEPYVNVPGDLGQISQISAGRSHSCAVTLTGTALCWGYNTFGQIVAPLTLTPRPTIIGSPTVGGLLSASTGLWDDGVTFSYQWLRDGVAISGSNQNSFSPGEADFESQITVQVTGSKLGFKSVSLTSSPATVGQGNFFKVGEPQVSGASAVGSSLSVDEGIWDSGVNFSYQWFRDGVLVKTATTSKYTIGIADLGKRVFIRLTGTKNGYKPVSKDSEEVLVSQVSVVDTPCAKTIQDISQVDIDPGNWRNTIAQPNITGSVLLGKTVRAAFGLWPLGSKLCTFWVVGGQVVPNSTASSYKIQGSDVTKDLRLMVLGTSVSGVTLARFSDQVIVPKAVFARPKTPTVKGVAKVGVKLTGQVASWEAGTSYAYQWIRNGASIEGANTITYTPGPADLGDLVALRVCASKPYFADKCLISQGQTVSIGTITPVGRPAIYGSSLKLGGTLTGSTTVWMSGVNLKSQWFSNGVPIAGATGPHRVITQSDKGKELTYQITASSPGYQTVVVVSRGKKIP